MRGALGDMLADVTATHRDTMAEFLDLAALGRVVEAHRRRQADHGHALFAVMMFGLWLNNAKSAWKSTRPSRSGLARKVCVLS